GERFVAIGREPHADRESRSLLLVGDSDSRIASRDGNDPTLREDGRWRRLRGDGSVRPEAASHTYGGVHGGLKEVEIGRVMLAPPKSVEDGALFVRRKRPRDLVADARGTSKLLGQSGKTIVKSRKDGAREISFLQRGGTGTRDEGDDQGPEYVTKGSG